MFLYDGDCGFCTRAARWLGTMIGDTEVIRPWQTVDIGECGLTEDDLESASYWVEDGQARRGAKGIAAALTSADRRRWQFAGAMVSLPPLTWVAEAIYEVVARNRHRMPGASDACQRPIGEGDG